MTYWPRELNQLSLYGAVSYGAFAASGGYSSSGAEGAVVGEATTMVGDGLIYDGATNANFSEGQMKVVKDIGSTIAQITAGSVGLMPTPLAKPLPTSDKTLLKIMLWKLFGI